jgi:hypothetical protein
VEPIIAQIWFEVGREIILLENIVCQPAIIRVIVVPEVLV